MPQNAGYVYMLGFPVHFDAFCESGNHCLAMAMGCSSLNTMGNGPLCSACWRAGCAGHPTLA